MTKGIAVAWDEDAVSLDVAEGQRHEALLEEDVWIEACDAVGGLAELLGDEGFDSYAVREVVDSRTIQSTISTCSPTRPTPGARTPSPS